MSESTVQLRCHHCTQWLGETSQSLSFTGMFHAPQDREWVEGQRDTYRCKGCGWVNVFKPVANAAMRDWRNVEIKDEKPTRKSRAA